LNKPAHRENKTTSKTCGGHLPVGTKRKKTILLGGEQTQTAEAKQITVQKGRKDSKEEERVNGAPQFTDAGGNRRATRRQTKLGNCSKKKNRGKSCKGRTENA